ncbi:MAG: hypothetical protein ABR915_09270 [Thermoguttaceae bacterium]|jgi:hypothetical protein
MNEPAILIRLDGGNRIYRPGESLSGEYRLESVEGDPIRAVEVSVLWYSEGKGEQDLAIHEFWRRDTESGDWIDPRRPERFSTTLPPSPLSYEGQIVQVRWCVRVRAFFEQGRELLAQKIFRLGDVPPA